MKNKSIPPDNFAVCDSIILRKMYEHMLNNCTEVEALALIGITPEMYEAIRKRGKRGEDS